MWQFYRNPLNFSHLTIFSWVNFIPDKFFIHTSGYVWSAKYEIKNMYLKNTHITRKKHSDKSLTVLSSEEITLYIYKTLAPVIIPNFCLLSLASLLSLWSHYLQENSGLLWLNVQSLYLIYTWFDSVKLCKV